MLGDPSEFTPLDLLGGLAVNAISTNVACKSDAFRVGIKNKTGDIPAWADYRFLGGVAAAAVAQFGGPMVRRAGHDAAMGLLGSYVSTETCRRHAMEKIQANQGGQPAAQIPAGQAPAGQAAGSGAYAYGEDYGW